MKKRNIFWGLLLIIASILIIVNKLGYFTEISVFTIIVTVILLGIMIKSVIYISFPGILFPAALICIMYAEQWNITNLTPWPVLATALLGSIGLSMIFKSHGHWDNHWCHKFEGEEFSEVINEADGNVINCAVSFGSSMKYINTDNFERANIKCSFGAMKVYFDNAIISSGNAEIYVDVSFSGVELYIPKTWNIVFEANSTFGGIDEKNRRTESSSPTVKLKGNVSFAGVEIIYV